MRVLKTMARRRIRPNIKDSITCDVPLDDEVLMSFDVLRAKFAQFAETNGIDLKDVKISERSIRGSFTDKSGVVFNVDFTPNGEGSKLEGSISKEMKSMTDTSHVGSSARTFIEELFQG